ncbi:MAG: amidohydrolase [Thermomicrobiales bacterium]
MGTAASIHDEIKGWEQDLIATRRDLHMHPELGFEEFRTSGIVAERLRGIGYDDVQTGIAVTGVKAVLRGGRPGKTLLLRADMDALPIAEESDAEYRSQNPGVMHACGHDAHTAMLLTAARVLLHRREEIPGTIVLCFQPAEEGLGGAKRMLDEGVLAHPQVDAALGLHVAQDLPLGIIMAYSGAGIAAADIFDVTIQGRGGHAAMPHTTVDALMVAATIMTTLQTLVSREVDPLSPAVVTTGFLHAGGTAHNVVADTATFGGTVRWFDRPTGELLARRLPTLIEGLAASMQASAEVAYTRVVQPTVNEPGMAALIREVAAAVPEVTGAISGTKVMGSEDFSEFTQRVPAAFFAVGTRDEASGKVWGHHHPKFDIDERAMAIGVGVMVRSALSWLEHNAG